ncbi:MAG: hypothetical protein WEE64_16145 [Dehalococcoidia bacterium]
MLYLTYVVFLALTSWALARASGFAVATGRLGEWRATAFVMLGLPVALAAAMTALLLRDALPVWGLFVCVGTGVLALAAGILARHASVARAGLPLRIAGWTLISGVLLIPATTSLLAPTAGLLAFFVPRTGPTVMDGTQPAAPSLEPQHWHSDV